MRVESDGTANCMGLLAFETQQACESEGETQAALTTPQIMLVVEIQAGEDWQRVGRQTDVKLISGKAEAGLRNTVQRRVSVG